MLVTLNEVLKDAQQKHYAVGLFNTVDLEMAKGVLSAAEELNSPVIIGTAEVLLSAATLKELTPILLSLAKSARIPVVLHYDHGLTQQRIREAIALGFSSIMYDCSEKSFEDNIASVAAVTDYTHALGVTVEGELGHVGANTSEFAGEKVGSDKSIYTDPLDAKTFADRTGVDALAVAIGTAHGSYKEKPVLDIERLKVIASLVKVPLVLHGGSGLSDDDFRTCVASGVAKVNIFTDINMAAAKAAHDAYRTGAGTTDIMPTVIKAVQQETMKKMLVFGSAGHGGK